FRSLAFGFAPASRSRCRCYGYLATGMVISPPLFLVRVHFQGWLGLNQDSLSVQFTVIQQADCYLDIGQSLHLYETKTSAETRRFVADRKRTDHSARSREVLVECAARYGAGKIANINPGHLDLLCSSNSNCPSGRPKVAQEG